MSVASLLQNRNFIGLVLANTVLGAAFPIQLVLGGLSGLQLAPDAALATLPSSVQTLAALIAAGPLSLLMGRLGRPAGFALGALLTLVGALVATLALLNQSFVWLCIAHFLMGAGWSAFQFFRFAAGEVVDTTLRPVAISLMLSSLLVAALVGPQIFVVAKDALAPIPFAGAYLAVAALSVVGLLPLGLVKMPRPVQLSKRTPTSVSASLAALRCGSVQRAVAVAAVAQGVMVFLMIPTPIAMIACGFDETSASDVIRWHIVAMFAPSFFTGFVVQRLGAQPVAMVGLATIAVAAAAAALGITAVHFYGALIILGLGWNFSFIGATTLLAEAVSDVDKSAIQGANDTIIALVSTVCAFVAGWVVTSLGWTVLAVVSGMLVLSVLAALILRPGRVQTV